MCISRKGVQWKEKMIRVYSEGLESDSFSVAFSEIP